MAEIIRAGGLVPMRSLFALSSFGAGIYYLWTGAAIQENFIAMGLLGFAFLLELSAVR
jgi:hypothetical protein